MPTFGRPRVSAREQKLAVDLLKMQAEINRLTSIIRQTGLSVENILNNENTDMFFKAKGLRGLAKSMTDFSSPLEINPTDHSADNGIH